MIIVILRRCQVSFNRRWCGGCPMTGSGELASRYGAAHSGEIYEERRACEKEAFGKIVVQAHLSVQWEGSAEGWRAVQTCNHAVILKG